MITVAEKLLLATNKSKPYVEFVSSTSMTITPKYTNTGVTLQYSLNGTTWKAIASGATTPSANIIYFRGKATGTKSLYASSSTNYSWIFTGATNLECNGKLDRLLQDDFGGDNDILTLYIGCFVYMFYNAATLIKAPELPATTLAANCYDRMFYGCTSLTTLPKLNVLTMPAYCYRDMFRGCTKIKISTTLTGIYDTAYRIPTAGTGTTATDAFLYMFTSTGGTFTGTPSINTTYYTENTPV